MEHGLRVASCATEKSAGRTLTRLRALRSDLIDPTIALHHGRLTDVSVVLHSVWMDSESGLPDWIRLWSRGYFPVVAIPSESSTYVLRRPARNGSCR